MDKIIVRKDTYYDSVFLMLISKEIKNLSGVQEAEIGRASCRERW